MQSLLDAALSYASRGIPVFPCGPDDPSIDDPAARNKAAKRPATAHGFHDATVDPETIRAWWTHEPRYNIAFQPAAVGLATVDLDGETGLANWVELQAIYGEAPETWTVDSPRGGRHLHFKGDTRPSVSILADKVDTRGGGSYALLPPSVVCGNSYRETRDCEPSPLPTWINDALDAGKRERVRAADVALDRPQNVSRAAEYLRGLVRRGRVAREGDGGDELTFVTACEVLNLGLSPERATTLLDEVWNPHCQPPWELGELEVKVQNAAAYSQNEPGAFATPSPAETFGSVLDKLDLSQPVREEAFKRARFQPMTLEQLAQLPPPTWLVPDLIPAKRITLLYGDQGSYKSFMALGQCLELATIGIPTVYVAGEGARELEQRAQAWKLLHGVGGELPIWIVGDMPQVAEPDQILELIDAIGAGGIRPQLIVVDTVFRAMLGLNENAAEDMGKMVSAAEAIQKAFDCAVMLIHHKGNSGDGPRGSSSLLAAVDAAIEVKNDKETKAVAMWVRRMKDAAERTTPFTFQGREIGPSLAFQAIDYDEYRSLTGEHSLDVRAIVAVLMACNARGQEAGISTDILAFELMKDSMPADPVLAEKTKKKMARLLVQGSRTNLAGYSYAEGNTMLWFLPDHSLNGAGVLPAPADAAA